MAIRPPARLGDEHVVLRPLHLADARPYAAAFVDDPDLGAAIDVETDPDVARARETIQRWRAQAREGTGVELAAADPVDGAFWGSIVAHHVVRRHRRCEVGYWLAPAVRGRGIGARATAHMVTWLFEGLAMERVELTTTTDNRASQALARRLGFTREGTLRERDVEHGRRVDIVMYGLLRAEWHLSLRARAAGPPA